MSKEVTTTALESARKALALSAGSRIAIPYYTKACDRSAPKPLVEVRLAISSHTLFALWKVQEEETIARASKDQDPVYKDSCVELFFSVDARTSAKSSSARVGDSADETKAADYFNFEFNCLGVMLAARGPDIQHRTPLADDICQRVMRSSSACVTAAPPRLPCKVKEWELLVGIPKEAFGVETDLIKAWPALGFKCNSFKCGDDLQKPHWLSLFPIETETPFFHRPDSFQPWPQMLQL